jgi:choline-glycine betaine transporter
MRLTKRGRFVRDVIVGILFFGGIFGVWWLAAFLGQALAVWSKAVFG